MKHNKLTKTIRAALGRWLARRPRPVALANALGLFNEGGVETLLLDPASVYNVANPWPNRYLLVQRGASGYQYGDIAQGTLIPLGPSSAFEFLRPLQRAPAGRAAGAGTGRGGGGHDGDD